MDKNTLLWQSGSWALFIGGVLALYISLSLFMQMPYNLWLAIHNMLFVSSLFLGAFVGYYNRLFGTSFQWMLLCIAIFFAVMMLLYISSYAVMTTLFADKIVWIPFFYHDYNYHCCQSVVSYLNFENNSYELLKLQSFSFSIVSVLYFAAGSLGYGIKAVMDRK